MKPLMSLVFVTLIGLAGCADQIFPSPVGAYYVTTGKVLRKYEMYRQDQGNFHYMEVKIEGRVYPMESKMDSMSYAQVEQGNSYLVTWEDKKVENIGYYVWRCEPMK